MRTTFDRPKRSFRLARWGVEGWGVGSPRPRDCSYFSNETPISHSTALDSDDLHEVLDTVVARLNALGEATCTRTPWLSARLLEGEDVLPIVFHADHRPVARFRFVHQRIGECADLGIRQTACGSIRIFPLGIIVMDEHLQPRAGAGADPFEHLAVAVGIAESSVRAFADERVNGGAF